MKLNRETLKGKLVFLGTAGARYVAFGFERQAGGLYFGFDDLNVHVDPGPGAFVHSHRKGIEPFWTDVVILSHRHLDHCADVNHVLEAMTLGGKKRRGKLLCPSDCINDDPVVLKYTRGNIEETVIVEEGLKVPLSEELKVEFPIRHVHGVETYGVVFYWRGRSFGYVADTKFFDGLIDAYKNVEDLIILNVTLLEPNPRIDHLSVPDAERIIEAVRPKLAIITHFGRTMLRAKPWEVALGISDRTGIKVLAAYDNMILSLNDLQVVRQR
ncbi:MAG: MBL fold metallo-hydrolase [Thermovibrio sp.]|nr:MAG: MBL fold metallo-hydrolase [Thermovibrio sp.]